MAFLPLALSLGATAIQGYSQFQQQQYQAAVAKNNAKIASDNADKESFAFQMDRMRSDREYQAQEGALVASQAASGLDTLGWSQTAARQNIARVRGEQALDITTEGLAKVRNFQQQQANFLGEERAAKTNAWMGLAATAFQMGSTFAKSPQGQKTFGNSLIGGTG